MNQEILKYFKGDELAANVWLSKYAQENDKTPDNMHKRMAKEFARIEKKYAKSDFIVFGDKNFNPDSLSEYGRTRVDTLDEETIYNLFKGFKYIIPQGSIMSQLGSNSIGSLSNCFFVDTPYDSYGGIMKKDEELVQLMKRRAGVGIDISTLRPQGTFTSNAAKASTGAVSFMERFSNSTREVAQGGRRGALMISIDINHPDVMEFIKIKRDLTQVTGANISIKLNKEFMKAVEKDEDYILRFPCNVYDNNDKSLQLLPTLDYNVLEKIPESQSNGVAYIKKIKAREYWDEIIKSAHGVAEPGILFWDATLENGPDAIYEKYKPNGVNPCGEITLGEYDSCRLMAINLFSFVDNPFTENASFNFKKFYEINYEAMRLSDDLVDLEIEAVEKIIAKIKSDTEPDYIKATELNLWEKVLDIGKSGRRTGLGFTALGDVLAALGLKYDSDESLMIIEKIMQTKMESELDCTLDLSVLRGSFKGSDVFKEQFKGNQWHDFVEKMFPKQYNKMIRFGRRNVSFSTVAPTGCSKKDSLITSDEGFYKLEELGNINKKGFSNLTYKSLNVVQDNSTNKATNFFNNGVAQTRVITLDSGIELESTLNHQYKVFSDGEYVWKYVKDIEEGDLFVSRVGGYNKTTEPVIQKIDYSVNENNYWEFKPKEINQPTIMSPDLAELLGIIFGDGSTHKTGIRVACNYGAEQIDRTVYLCKKVFNIEPTVYKEHTCMSVNINSRTLLEYLKVNGLLKQKACDVEVPLLIRTSSKKSIESFLKGYWMADGSQTNNTKYIDTCSKTMAQQLITLYRGIGINARIAVYTNRENSIGNNPIYRVYQKQFGSIGFEKHRYINKVDRELLGSLRGYGEELFFDKVVSIENGSCLTLDIEVPNKNMYLLNSVVSHNTVSLMTQTTSGIEPLFQPFYIRRKKVNPGEDVKVDFVDQNGDSWQEFAVLHPKFKDWVSLKLSKDSEFDNLTKDDFKKLYEISPWYGSTANNIDWIKRVEIQSIIQKYITHSISSTINLPKTVSEKEVSDIYMEAWKQGLKGITVYVDGSRSGVLVSEPQPLSTTDEFGYTQAVKRPKELDAHYYFATSKGAEYAVIVGLMNNKPYEIFVDPNPPCKENGEGKLIKIKKGVYSYISDRCAIDNLQLSTNGDERVLTRWISLLLRHGANPKYVIEQVDKSEVNITSFVKVLARTLKRYIGNGDTSSMSCAECGGKNVVFEEGCASCKDCGSSKCG